MKTVKKTLNDHNAYYVSKRFYYETSLIFHNPDERPNTSEWCILQKISHLWLGVLLIIVDVLTIHTGIKRYLSYRTYSTDPSKGLDWNLQVPLSIQAASLIISGSLLPVLTWTLFTKNGHPVNDGFSLGKQMIHTIQSNVRQQMSTGTAYGGDEGMSNVSEQFDGVGDKPKPNSLRGLLGSKGKREKERGQKITDQDYQRTKKCFWLKSNLKPVSITIQVVIAIFLIFPVPILHAEMIRNEVMAPETIWHSDLDIVFGIYQRMHTAEEIKQLLNDRQIYVLDTVEITHLSSALRNQRYEVRIADVSLEFFNLAISLSIFILKYSVPFWFTSRAFTAIISFYLLISGIFMTTSISTISIMYKVIQVGIIIPGRTRIDKFSDSDVIFTPIVCLFSELIGNFCLIICLVSIYDFGEGLFEKAHLNYLNLTAFSQIGHRVNKERSQKITNDYEENNSEDFIELASEPCLISVTTKYWQPDYSQRRQKRLRDQYTSDMKSLTGTGGTLASNKIYLNHSEEMLIDESFLPPIKSCLLPLIFGFISLFLFTVARVILFQPYLDFYRKNNSMYALIHLIGSIILAILLLILWFCLALKTSWRFRLIHANQPSRETTTCTPLSTLPSNNNNNNTMAIQNNPILSSRPSEYDIYAADTTPPNVGSHPMNSYVYVKPTEVADRQHNNNNSLRVNPIVMDENFVNRQSQKHQRLRPSPMVVNETLSSYDSPKIDRYRHDDNDQLPDPYASLSSLQQNLGNNNDMTTTTSRLQFTTSKVLLDPQQFTSFRQSPLNAYRSPHKTDEDDEDGNYLSNHRQQLVLPLAREKKISYEQLCSQV